MKLYIYKFINYCGNPQFIKDIAEVEERPTFYLEKSDNGISNRIFDKSEIGIITHRKELFLLEDNDSKAASAFILKEEMNKFKYTQYIHNVEKSIEFLKGVITHEKE